MSVAATSATSAGAVGQQQPLNVPRSLSAAALAAGQARCVRRHKAFCAAQRVRTSRRLLNSMCSDAQTPWPHYVNEHSFLRVAPVYGTTRLTVPHSVRRTCRLTFLWVRVCC